MQRLSEPFPRTSRSVHLFPLIAFLSPSHLILPLPHDLGSLTHGQTTTGCVTKHVLVCDMSQANVCRWMKADQPRPRLLLKLVPAVPPSPRPARSAGRAMMMRMRLVVEHAEFESCCTLSANWVADHDAKHSLPLQLPCCWFVEAGLWKLNRVSWQ